MNRLRDTATQLACDGLSALGLLTRLPAPQTTRHRADAAWCWPLVGLVVGALVAGVGAGAMALGLPPGLGAVAMIATGAVATGALHEDGLADTADGLFGGWTPERRLEIMKDSHIGSYGTLALILMALAKLEVLATLLGDAAYGPIIAASVISRAPMAVIMALMPPARASGLAQSVGRPSVTAAFMAAGLAMALGLALAPGEWGMIPAAAMAALGVAWIARARIGGQTGDILGASQQMAELAALVATSAIVTLA